MSEFLTTREVAELLRIKERKVYDLASSGKIPCSKATGKLLFPKAEIEQWLSAHSSQGTPDRPAVLLGSHDPLLEWALRASGCGIASFFDGSLDGIERYSNGEGIATGLHIYEPSSKKWNTPIVSDKLASKNIAVMEWASRQRGFILSNDCSQNVQSIDDLQQLTIVPRQAGAGSQMLLENLMRDAQLDDSMLTLLEPERTESDAVLPILQGRAHATLGLATVAEQYSLKFAPIIEERYDLVVDRRYWFEPAWQTFLEFCHSEEFISKAVAFTGYNVSQLGTIHFNGK